MRLLHRDTTEFTYSAFAGKTEILKDGKHTGKFELTYADPVSYTGNISIPYGQAQQQLFGIDTRYTHVLLMDDPEVPMREDGIIECNGVKYDIKAIRRSHNVLSVALIERLPGDA